MGVQQVKAEPYTYSEYCAKYGFLIEPGKENDKGYLVEFPNGKHAWYHTDAFEKTYLELNDPTKITSGDVIRFLGVSPYEVGQLDDKTTLVKMTTRTGFVQYETSSCVDPTNYNEQLGADICIDRLNNNKLWPMLGFVLQWAKNGLDKVGELTISKVDKN